MHKHNSKPAGRATTLLFAGFLAVFLLGVVLNIGFLFFQYNTSIGVQGVQTRLKRNARFESK